MASPYLDKLNGEDREAVIEAWKSLCHDLWDRGVRTHHRDLTDALLEDVAKYCVHINERCEEEDRDALHDVHARDGR